MNSICMKIYIKYLKLKLAEVCISLRKFEDLQNYIRNCTQNFYKNLIQICMKNLRKFARFETNV